ncbi:O-antigen ligase family protein [Candidatus Aminicenantes bacterium AC-334-K16]|nr:O-antigen ligase family protein [Candidatus Aminicenantes bacterium AC-334-K16]
MFFGLCVTTIVNPSGKSFNYLLAYMFIFGISYLFLKGVMYNFCNIHKLLNINTIAVLFIVGFSILDFVTYHFLKIDIQQIIPRNKAVTATYFGGLVRRSYGLSTEPTVLALYFNTLGILGIWNLWRQRNVTKNLKSLLTIIFWVAWILTFSAAGWGALFVSGIISFFLMNIVKKEVILSKKQLKKAFAIMLISIIAIFVFYDEFRIFFSPIIRKVLLMEDVGDRIYQWKWGLENIANSPIFGYGLGSTLIKRKISTLNWYIFLTLEGGFISSIPLIFFIFFSYVRIFRSKVKEKFWFMLGFLAGSLHFLAISTFYYPFLWFFLIMFIMYERKSISNIKTL